VVVVDPVDAPEVVEVISVIKVELVVEGAKLVVAGGIGKLLLTKSIRISRDLPKLSIRAASLSRSIAGGGGGGGGRGGRRNPVLPNGDPKPGRKNCGLRGAISDAYWL